MPPITTGCLTSIWLHLQPPFSSDITLSGAIRFDPKNASNQEVELHNSRIDVVPSSLPIQLTIQHNCPIEIVSLIQSDRTNPNTVYRVRRRYTQLLPNEQDSSLLVGRLTFGNSMTSLSSDPQISSSLTMLYKTTKSMKPKTIALMLGKTFSSSTNTSIKQSKNVTKNLKQQTKKLNNLNNLSPWADPEDGLVGRKITSPTPTSRARESKQQRDVEIGGVVTTEHLSKDEFVAIYVATWRILIGTFIHLDITPGKTRKFSCNYR